MNRTMAAVALGVLVAATGCASRSRGYDPDYDGRYRRVDPYVLEQHQEREQERLDARQRAERERLLREQARERRGEKDEGDWDRGDQRDQRRERKRQAGRFERQDRALEQHQEDERERYGY